MSDFYQKGIFESGGHVMTEMTLGYKQAADSLVSIIESQDGDWGILAYPILFLYRQHIELAMKAAMSWIYAYERQGVELGVGSTEPKQVEPTGYGHDLSEAWSYLRPKLEDLDLPLDSRLTDRAEGVINWIVRRDPQSMTFRYPEVWLQKMRENELDVSPLEMRQGVEEVSSAIDGLTAYLRDLIRIGEDISL